MASLLRARKELAVAHASDERDPGRRVDRRDASPWNWLLLLPLVAVLVPTVYNRKDPELFGIPFFYWYELAAIGLGVATTALVYRMTRS